MNSSVALSREGPSVLDRHFIAATRSGAAAAMLAHYLVVTLRNFRRTPVSALVNVLTLSVGLASFMTTYAVAEYWTKVDGYYSKSDRIYAITTEMEFDDGAIRPGLMPVTNQFYAPHLEAENPELEAVVRTYEFPDVSVTTADRGARLTRLIADEDFFDLFEMPFTVGDPATALRQPRSVVLTQETAERLFGNQDPMGQTVVLANSIDTTVTGVIAAIPKPSHFENVDIITSWDIRRALQLARNPNAPEPRDNLLSGYSFITFVVLPSDGSLTEPEFRGRLAGFAERHLTPEQLQSSRLKVDAVPLGGLSVAKLNNNLFGGAAGSMSVSMLLMGLGALVLLVACINYASLATARALGRARETGLRKTMGATRAQIAQQYLLESALLVSFAVVLAAVATAAFAPALEAIADIDIATTVLNSAGFYSFLAALLLIVTLLAGAYPALVLSGVGPLAALRLGQLKAGPKSLTRWLVGAQFFAASFLLIAIIVMHAQTVELRESGLGRLTDPLLVIDNAAALSGIDNETLRTELLRLPQISGVTEVGITPLGAEAAALSIVRSLEPGATSRTAFHDWVGYDFFDVLEVPLIAGRVFDRDHADIPPKWEERDPDVPFHIVIDDKFARELGFETPDAAVDEIIYIPADPGLAVDVPQALRVIGVVESRPLHISSVVGTTSNIFWMYGQFETLIARVDANDVAGALAGIDRMWARIAPTMPRSRKFLDEVFDETYAVYLRVSQAFAALAVVALLIAVVGLFGMAAQVANRRLHEIAVRKTLGATTPQVAQALLLDFGKPVLIANVAAWPLAYVAAQAYLSTFMHRIAITPLPFILSLALTLAVGALVVVGHAVRAARTRPAAVLSSE